MIGVRVRVDRICRRAIAGRDRSAGEADLLALSRGAPGGRARAAWREADVTSATGSGLSRLTRARDSRSLTRAPTLPGPSLPTGAPDAGLPGRRPSLTRSAAYARRGASLASGRARRASATGDANAGRTAGTRRPRARSGRARGSGLVRWSLRLRRRTGIGTAGNERNDKQRRETHIVRLARKNALARAILTAYVQGQAWSIAKLL